MIRSKTTTAVTSPNVDRGGARVAIYRIIPATPQAAGPDLLRSGGGLFQSGLTNGPLMDKHLAESAMPEMSLCAKSGTVSV